MINRGHSLFYRSVFLRVLVNPWKTGRNKGATGTERVKGIPWNDFCGSTEHVTYIPLPVKNLFSTELTRPVFHGKMQFHGTKLVFFSHFRNTNTVILRIFYFQFWKQKNHPLQTCSTFCTAVEKERSFDI